MSWGGTIAFLFALAMLWLVDDRVTEQREQSRALRAEICAHFERQHSDDPGAAGMLNLCRGRRT